MHLVKFIGKGYLPPQSDSIGLLLPLRLFSRRGGGGGGGGEGEEEEQKLNGSSLIESS